MCSNESFKRHTNVNGETPSNGVGASFLYSSKEKKSVASSMKRKPENPKKDIYGVARQNNFKFPMNNMTAPSDSYDFGPACLVLKAGSALTLHLPPV